MTLEFPKYLKLIDCSGIWYYSQLQFICNCDSTHRILKIFLKILYHQLFSYYILMMIQYCTNIVSPSYSDIIFWWWYNIVTILYHHQNIISEYVVIQYWYNIVLPSYSDISFWWWYNIVTILYNHVFWYYHHQKLISEYVVIQYCYNIVSPSYSDISFWWWYNIVTILYHHYILISVSDGDTILIQYCTIIISTWVRRSNSSKKSVFRV